MAIYKILNDELLPLSATSFAKESIKERDDLQRLLKKKIDVISPATLVISEEFSEWDGSNRRIDLLGLDTDANIVVIELKRTEDGGFMDLQAIRYASMVSALTFDRAEKIFQKYLDENAIEAEAKEELLDFLGWDEVDEEQFAQEARIVLASAEFSKELTTSVIWLNTQGLDIRCIRLKPYNDGDNLLLDVQQVIPLPEAEEYQVKIRDKQRKEKIFRSQAKDRNLFSISFNDEIEAKDFKKSDIGLNTVLTLEKYGLINDEAFDFLREDKSCSFLLLKTKEEMTDTEMKYGKYRYKNEAEIIYKGIGYFVARNWGVGNVPQFIEKMSKKFEGLTY